jgi:hypothetical protein
VSLHAHDCVVGRIKCSATVEDVHTQEAFVKLLRSPFEAQVNGKAHETTKALRTGE